MLVKLSNGKTKDVQIKDVTPENYVVPNREERLYHCLLEVKRFDAASGKRQSVPRIQKFEPRAFESFIRRELVGQGFDIVVLHNPREWEKAEAAKKEAEKEAENKAE